MIKLKQVIHFTDTNSVEATWVREIAPAYVVPEQRIPEVQDAEGNVIQQAQVIPEHTVPAVEEVVRCHSYADVQMAMLEADLGADAAEYAELIAKVRAGIKPPVPTSPEEVRAGILAQIDTLERTQLMPRATREFMLLFMESSFSAEQLAANPGYQAVKAFDEQVKALRRQL